MLQINTHDIVGYNELYHRYYKFLVMYADGIVGDMHMAEDIVENVIVALWKGDKTFDDVKSFESYVIRATHNMSVNELKRRDVENRFVDNVVALHSELHESYDDEYDQLLVRLIEYVDSLPDKMRDVINKSLEGMTSKQIAENMSISVETVKTHRKRALRILREAFGLN